MAKFPSPIGVLYISIIKMRKPSVTRTIVSVPYWGSLYFNRYSKDTYDVLSWFPSPIGVLYISI